MTAQMNDRIFYEGEWYDLAGINGEGMFEPSEHGMEPRSNCSACWRGYVAVYEVRDNHLLLNTLYINATKVVSEETGEEQFGTLASLGSAEHVTEGPDIFDFAYEDADLPLEFTGGLLIARDFIQDIYVHMGFHPAWKYEHIHELEFDKGVLTKQEDVSRKLAEVREKLRKDPSVMDGIGIEWIHKCFSREYDF